MATTKMVAYKCRPDQPKKVIQAKFHPYALRHVAASLWIEMGVQPKRLQTLMGHSSIKITMDTYGHLSVSCVPKEPS
jgi:integrase